MDITANRLRKDQTGIWPRRFPCVRLSAGLDEAATRRSRLLLRDNPGLHVRYRRWGECLQAAQGGL